MPLIRCNIFHRSSTLAWACTKLCTVCMTNGIYMAVSILPCRAMNILAFHVVHYILHFLAKFEPSLSKPLSCFLLGWSTPVATLLPPASLQPEKAGEADFHPQLHWLLPAPGSRVAVGVDHPRKNKTTVQTRWHKLSKEVQNVMDNMEC